MHKIYNKRPRNARTLNNISSMIEPKEQIRNEAKALQREIGLPQAKNWESEGGFLKNTLSCFMY